MKMINEISLKRIAKYKMTKIAAMALVIMLCQFGVMKTSYAAENAVILVLDVQSTLQNSAAGKQVKDQLDAKQTVFIKEIESKESELKALEQDLIRQRTVLSQEVFQEKKKDFDEKMMALNQRFQEQRQVLDKSFGEARNKLMKDIFAIVEDIKTERGANLVLHASQVIVSDNTMDVTSEVLQRLNKKVPSFKVNF